MYIPTLQFPFPSDLNTDLGGRKRRKSNTEVGLTVLIVCCICSMWARFTQCWILWTVSSLVKWDNLTEDVCETLGNLCSDCWLIFLYLWGIYQWLFCLIDSVLLFFRFVTSKLSSSVVLDLHCQICWSFITTSLELQVALNCCEPQV